MTQQEYDKAKQECYQEYLDYTSEKDTPRISFLFTSAFDRAYALGKQTGTITQEEIEKAAWEYSDSQRESNDDDHATAYSKGFKDGANYALGKQEEDADTVIQGWVCRDKIINEPFISDLFLAFDRPSRIEEWGKWGDMGDYIELDSNLFPDLTWESDPIKVSILIKRE